MSFGGNYVYSRRMESSFVEYARSWLFERYAPEKGLMFYME